MMFDANTNKLLRYQTCCLIYILRPSWCYPLFSSRRQRRYDCWSIEKHVEQRSHACITNFAWPICAGNCLWTFLGHTNLKREKHADRNWKRVWDWKFRPVCNFSWTEIQIDQRGLTWPKSYSCTANNLKMVSHVNMNRELSTMVAKTLIHYLPCNLRVLAQ